MWIKTLIEKNWGVIYCKGNWPIEKGKAWKDAAHMEGIKDHRAHIMNMYGLLMERADDMGLHVVHVDTQCLAKQRDPFQFNKMAFMADRRQMCAE
jgi:hypothetical protein